MTRWLWLGAALAVGAAGPPPGDPDWPCVQRLVPRVTATTYWPGHQAAGDWRADPRAVPIVAAAAPRGVTPDVAVARVQQAAASLPPADRASVLPLVFAGLVDETNVQRAQVIERLRGITRRQRAAADAASRVMAELRALPADTPDAQREEAVSRRALMIREYEEVERTIRYACEAPGQMEAKLGTLAKALQQAAGKQAPTQ